MAKISKRRSAKIRPRKRRKRKDWEDEYEFMIIGPGNKPDKGK